MGIRNLNKGIFFFLIAFMFVNHTQSQTDFIIHKVRKNQDIEKIAMIYDVDVNIILEEVPLATKDTVPVPVNLKGQAKIVSAPENPAALTHAEAAS